MARLIAMKKIGDPTGFANSEQTPPSSPMAEKSDNGHCVVDLDSPQSPDQIVQKNDLKKSPSIGNFCSKRVPVNVEWSDITFKAKKNKTILNQLSGGVYSGELTAIMGPSGAGKSTLLNVLTGLKQKNVTGEILVNGVERDMRVFRKISCYILQDDYLLPRLTVRETVTVAANLKIPSYVPEEDKRKAVNDCLHSLGLTVQQNQKASQLSGGQRKRLCIAQELVSNPPLIFLDEPTSGLDSSSCLQCIQLLKSLAEEGRTVVCTIHQPNSKVYEIFDKLYMIADGHCIYRGPTQELIPFLARQGLNCPQYHNPTDYVTEVAIGVYGDWIEKLKTAIDSSDDINENCLSQLDLQEAESKQDLNFQASTTSLVSNKSRKANETQDKLLDKTHNGYATSSFNQFKVLFWRSFLCILRDPMNTKLKFIGNVAVGLLLGTMYYGIGNDATKVINNTALMFCVTIYLIFTAKMPTLLTFPLQKTIFDREHMNSWYSTRMYYLATTLAEIPFQILFPVIMCTIVYWMTGQPSDVFRFYLFLQSAVFLSLVAQSIGLLIGVGSDIQNGVYIASASSIPTLLFCGFLITINTIPSYLRWLSYCSYARYTFQSFVLSLYSLDRPFLHCNKTLCPFEDPAAIIKELDMDGNLYVDYSALLGFLIFFRLVAYLLLRFKAVRILS